MKDKRKLYLKKWVEVAIIFIQAILIMTLAGGCDDLKIFIVSKIIVLVIFFVNHLILVKYTNCLPLLINRLATNFLAP